MTVWEMIEELIDLAQKGHGDREVGLSISGRFPAVVGTVKFDGQYWAVITNAEDD